MVTSTIKKILPNYVKHPILATSNWYWNRRGLPAQSPGDLAIFKEILLNVSMEDLRIFEWGSGSSTVYYSQFLKASGRKFNWYAADNSAEWCRRCQKKIDKAMLTEQVHLSCFEFPAFWEISGYTYERPIPPQHVLDDPLVAKYVEAPKRVGEEFDVAIIDGRFRRRCLEVAAQVLAPHGIVVLHDAQRSHYHKALDIYQQVEFVETGRLPGLKTDSVIALAGLENVRLIPELARKHRTPRSQSRTK